MLNKKPDLSTPDEPPLSFSCLAGYKISSQALLMLDMFGPIVRANTLQRGKNQVYSCVICKSLTVTFIFFPVEISWDGNGWIKGNIGQTGFYRVNYEESNWDALAAQLRRGDHKVKTAKSLKELITISNIIVGNKPYMESYKCISISL